MQSTALANKLTKPDSTTPAVPGTVVFKGVPIVIAQQPESAAAVASTDAKSQPIPIISADSKSPATGQSSSPKDYPLGYEPEVHPNSPKFGPYFQRNRLFMGGSTVPHFGFEIAKAVSSVNVTANAASTNTPQTAAAPTSSFVPGKGLGSSSS